MLFGWGRPVQVNLDNFRHRRRDDILVSGAGPAMNLLLVFVLLSIMKVFEWAGGENAHLNSLLNLARLSLFLCFFNLLPIPPLDGGHIMRNLLGIGDEAYQIMSRYSFMFLVIVMRSEAVGDFISVSTNSALALLALPFGWHLTNS
jgi:Zn-dependent protease